MINVPSYLEVKKSIEEFSKLTLLKFNEFNDVESYMIYIEDIYYKYFPSFHYMMVRNNTNEVNLSLFRVREFDSIRNKNNLKEYSYPPAHIVESGRCNFKNFPVFYSSNQPITALLEVVKNSQFENKTFCISAWEFRKINNSFSTAFFLNPDILDDEFYKGLANSFLDNINKAFEGKLNKDQIKGVREFYNYFHKCFIEDQDYSISAYLTHKRIYSTGPLSCDMIIYPSSQLESKSLNFALSPKFVDNFLSVERFYLVSIDQYDITENSIKLIFEGYGIRNDNDINWFSLQPGDLLYENNIRKDFGDYASGSINFE